MDLPRVVEFRRKLLKVRDGYQDALLEMGQALADLAVPIRAPGLASTCVCLKTLVNSLFTPGRMEAGGEARAAPRE